MEYFWASSAEMPLETLIEKLYNIKNIRQNKSVFFNFVEGEMSNLFLYIAIGVFAGAISGLIGIGGGIIVVPCLIYIFGFSQHAAQGTTLAMLIPPIGLLAAWAYYKQGYVNIPVAGLLCLGFVLGGYFGAKFALGFSEVALRKIFGFCLLVIAGYMIIK